MPKHGDQRNYAIHNGCMGGPGLHSEEERYCDNCKRWCFLSGTAGALYFAMLHNSKECIAPIESIEDSPWLKRLKLK